MTEDVDFEFLEPEDDESLDNQPGAVAFRPGGFLPAEIMKSLLSCYNVKDINLLPKNLYRQVCYSLESGESSVLPEDFYLRLVDRSLTGSVDQVLLELLKLPGDKPQVFEGWDGLPDLLAGLPEHLAQAMLAAAIPHWFDAGVIEALLEVDASQAQQLYRRLRSQSVVEVCANRGYCLVPPARRIVLARLWRQDREHFLQLSHRAEQHFRRILVESALQNSSAICLPGESEPLPFSASDGDAHLSVERIYHLALVDREAAVGAVREQGLIWQQNLVHDYSYLEELVKAINEHAEPLFARLNWEEDAEVLGWAAYWEGILAWHLEPTTGRAVKLFERSAYRSGPMTDLCGRSFKRLAEIHFAAGNMEDAMGLMNTALERFHSIGDQVNEARCLKAVGDMYFHAQAWPDAERYYNRACDISFRIDDLNVAADCYRALGSLYLSYKVLGRLSDYNLYRLDQSMNYFHYALDCYEDVNNPEGIASTLHGMGLVRMKQQNMNEALTLFSQALKLAKEIGNAQVELEIIDSAAQLYDSAREVAPFSSPSLDWQLFSGECYQLGQKFLKAWQPIQAVDCYALGVRFGVETQMAGFQSLNSLEEQLPHLPGLEDARRVVASLGKE